MNRRHVLAAAAVAAVGVAFVSGASVAPRITPPAAAKKAAAGHKTAVFNMAAVMRDFHQAKYQVWLLNKKKEKQSAPLAGWRDEYVKIQTELKTNPNHPKKDDLAETMLELARKIEDTDRKLNKQLNDDASGIIADLHDMIKAAVDRTAEADGFQLVLAYPDAVTPDELASPYVKELKLKPPAAQPFYVAPSIDITARVVNALNAEHPPIDADTKQPVDTSKLDVPVPAPKGPPAPLPPVPSVPGALPRSGPAPKPIVPVPTPKP